MLKWISERLRRRNAPRPSPHIEMTGDGFVVVRPHARSTVRWASVVAVVTYKNDLFSYDEIVIAFEVLERPGELQEVSEKWPGFELLFDQLERGLGISPDWYKEVMLPPFAKNYRVLFQRAAVRDHTTGPG